MGSETKIQWADATWNPWRGCTKVSPGCKNCYAEARDKRFTGGAHWGVGAPRELAGRNKWREPLRWNAAAGKQTACGDCDPCLGGRPDQCAVDPIKRPRVFCASLADVFDPEVPAKWRGDMLATIGACPNLNFLLLTKRPERIRQLCAEAFLEVPAGNDWVAYWLEGQIPANVWLGTSAENQEFADKRIPELAKTPARVRFVSFEPLLGPINVERYLDMRMIGWGIIGGESGPNSRTMQTGWAYSLIKQFKDARVPPFMKQMGKHTSVGPEHPIIWNDPKGGDPAEWPAGFNVREFPL